MGLAVIIASGDSGAAVAGAAHSLGIRARIRGSRPTTRFACCRSCAPTATACS